MVQPVVEKDTYVPKNNIRKKGKKKNHIRERQAACYLNPEEGVVEFNWNFSREERPCKGRK